MDPVTPTKRNRPWTRAPAASLLALGCAAIGLGATRLRQDLLDSRLIAGVKQLNVARVERALREGANPDAVELPDSPFNVQRLLDCFRTRSSRRPYVPHSRRSALRLCLLSLYYNPWIASDDGIGSDFSINQQAPQRHAEDHIALALIRHGASVQLDRLQRADIRELANGPWLEPDNRHGVSGVLFAAIMQHPVIVKAMLAHGADPGRDGPADPGTGDTRASIDRESLRLLARHGINDRAVGAQAR